MRYDIDQHICADSETDAVGGIVVGDIGVVDFAIQRAYHSAELNVFAHYALLILQARHDYFSLTERDRVRYTLFASIWTVVFSFLYLVLFMHSATGSVLTSVASHLIL